MYISGQHREEKERKRKLLDRLEDEEVYNTELRRRKIEIELQRSDIMFKAQILANETLFKSQIQEKADMNNDARYIMRHKLQRELQDTFLDNTHDRARDFVAERSNTMLAMNGVRIANAFASASATTLLKSTTEEADHNNDEDDTPEEGYFLK